MTTSFEELKRFVEAQNIDVELGQVLHENDPVGHFEPPKVFKAGERQ